MKVLNWVLRWAVLAVAFTASVAATIEGKYLLMRGRLKLALYRLETLLWSLEIARLCTIAMSKGWKVRFVPLVADDPLSLSAGATLHDSRTILVRNVGLSRREIADVLRHELDHAAGVRHAWAPEWLRCMGTWRLPAGLVSFAFETVAGSVIGISASLPGTYDVAGFGATSMVYSPLGEITDLGNGYGRAYNTVNHAPIASAQQKQLKGSYTLAAIELTMAWDDDDAGQAIALTASENNSIYSFEIIKQGGARRYFTAQVSKFVENFGTVDNVVVGMVTLLPQTNIVRDPA